MLLRASSQRDDITVDLAAVNDPTLASGVPHDDWLRALTEATIEEQWELLAEVRAEAAGVMGERAVVDTLVVAAAFNGITRVADATGIPLDDNTRASTGALRAEVGLDAFQYAEKSARYDTP